MYEHIYIPVRTVSMWLLLPYLYFWFLSFIHMSPSSESFYFFIFINLLRALGGKEPLICKLSDLYKDQDGCFSLLHLMFFVDTHKHIQAHYAVNPPV